VFESLIDQVSGLPASMLGEIEALATEVRGNALLPVIGAGGSKACLVKTAGELADDLWAAIDSGAIPGLRSLPEDAGDLKKGRDLGKVADLIAAASNPISNEDALMALGFPDDDEWPSADATEQFAQTTAHACAYRILARFARERLVQEAMTFNYDCHFEGALQLEGFQIRDPPHSRWPERYEVVSDEKSHSSIARRGDFTLNKVHGCVNNWRTRRALRDPMQEVSETIVLRWSQLLDWRSDPWSRDLFRDRARRHVLLLVGFGGADPVIHAALQATMREVAMSSAVTTPRIRVFDTRPDTLNLRLLVQAGRGSGGIETIRVDPTHGGLAGALLVLFAHLVWFELDAAARRIAVTLGKPVSITKFLHRMVIAGPTMLRTTLDVRQHSDLSEIGIHETLSRAGGEYYVPFSASPEDGVRLMQLREKLAAKLSIDPDVPCNEMPGWLRRASDARAYLPVALDPGSFETILRRASADVRSRWRVPATIIPILVGEQTNGSLVYFSVNAGKVVAA
jgi:hypothetical protein